MNKLFFLLLTITIISCSEANPYEKIDDFLKTEYNKDINIYNHLIVINEMGNCINCSNKFSKLMAEHINEKSILFLISSSGSRIDISPYLNKNAKNIVFDYRNKFAELNIVNQCSIINFDQGNINSINEINLGNLNKTVINFKNHISN